MNTIYRPDFSNPLLNACVGNNGGPYDYRDYARGYFCAAKSMKQSLTGTVELYDVFCPMDVLVYPMAFCLRHSTELYLKHFAIAFSIFLSKQIEYKFNHKLTDTWGIIKRIIEGEDVFIYQLNCDNNYISIIDKKILEISEIDGNGEVFRYPENKTNKRHLAKVKHINIDNLYSSYEELYEIFEHWGVSVQGLYDFSVITVKD